MKKMIATALVGGAAVAAMALAPSASAASDPDTVMQFSAAVNAEAARFGVAPVQVRIGILGDPNTIAETDGYATITLNSNWASASPDEFNALIAEDVASGFQPGGCVGIQAIAIHEVGHIVDRAHGLITRQAVSRAAYSGQIGSMHGYAYAGGRVNPAEAVAVSFQAAECGSATPTERAIYNVLVS